MRIKYQIFWLQIPVDNFVAMQILKRENDVGNKKFSLFLTEERTSP